ncbi:MAG: riboflavin synthase [Candidatus Omnitrophica bacterium]|nr:riboflavin synthase [Candidatus Omnitrophota bacterium]MCM8808611.1 riboflavin synthase [Candidatus Omnitrophota bacterium]
MFTGIIEEVGKIKGKRNKGEGLEILIEGEKIFDDLKVGDSISVNGVCLTVEKIENKKFSISISPQTKKQTNLGEIKIGEYVNLERALKIGDRIGGHFLTGHIDFKTKIKTLTKQGEFFLMKLEVLEEYRKYLVKRGSIGVDGISLTIAEIENNNVLIYLIPYTIENTNLKYRKTGDFVNIEIDIFARYLVK